jgi:uncharacterized BrkB/YihY/UPF0761 family membrane protein
MMRDNATMDRIRGRGVGTLAKETMERFRDADGASHARALAYQFAFVMLSGFIGLVGLASVLDIGGVRRTVQSMATTISPGPSGRLLEEATRQGAQGAGTAALFGLGAALVAGTLAMAQAQRSANRMLGDDDGPRAEHDGRALALAISAGLLLIVGGLVLIGGGSLAEGFGWTGSAADAWNVVRWPIGIAIVAGGLFLLFRRAPRRTLEDPGARIAGAAVAVAVWIVFSLLLSLYFAVGTGSRTYGPLLAVIALLLFAGATSFALHLGFAMTATLVGASSTLRVPESHVVRGPAPVRPAR